MRFDRVVKVDKPQQADLTALPISKNFLLMPHLHECTDHPFGLAVVVCGRLIRVNF